jgi:hypothetical protein
MVDIGRFLVNFSRRCHCLELDQNHLGLMGQGWRHLM